MKNRDIGRWIEIARTFRGITQKELAEQIENLQQSNLSKMEKGLLPINESVLNRISKALNFPPEFFHAEQPNLPITSFFYRKRISMPQRERAILDAGFDILRKTIDNLLDEFEIPDLRIPIYDAEELEITPHEAAIATRKSLQLGQTALSDIIGIIERNGIVVYEMETVPDKFDGITITTNKGYTVIIINKNMTADRKRFTLAHELGHFVLHINAAFINPNRDKEKEANEFASEFLFPKEEATRILRNLKFSDLGLIKSKWLISKAAIIYRASELGFLNDTQKKNYMIELSRIGERKKEKGDVFIDSPEILKAAIGLYKELNYNDIDLSQIAKLSKDTFSHFFLSEKPRLTVVWRNQA